jgi:hypothetical protein
VAKANESVNMAAAINPPPQQKRKPQFDPHQNHGRYAASDYPGCPSVSILHASLKSGDGCPACVEASLHGKLYALTPQVSVFSSRRDGCKRAINILR